MKIFLCLLLVMLCATTSGLGENYDVQALIVQDSEEEIIALLKQNPGNVNKYTWGLQPLLTLAVETGRHKVAEFILQNGGDPNLVDGQGETALFWCNSAEMSRLLVQFGADPNYRAHNKGTPLMKRVSSMINGQYNEEDHKAYFDVVRYLAEITEVTAQDVEFIKESYLFEGGRPKHLQNKLTPEDESRWQSLSAKIGLRIK